MVGQVASQARLSCYIYAVHKAEEMQNEQSRRQIRWFAERMPSKKVLLDVLQGDPVTRLLVSQVTAPS
jgi:hypothetical protein